MTIVQRAAIVVPIAVMVASTMSIVRAESLQEAWAITLSVNPQLEAQNLETAAVERSVAAAKQARVPTVRSFNLNTNLSTTPKIRPSLSNAAGTGAGAGSGAAALANSMVSLIGRNQTDLPISLTLASVPIYSGGRITNDIRAARSQQNYQQSEVFRTVLDLKVTVAEAYISVLRARRDLEVARSNVARLQSFANDVQNRKREGLACISHRRARCVVW